MIQAFQFGVGIVLARLLLPEDFGVFAVTSIFTGLAATVANIGLGAALVQRPRVTELHRRTMLTTNLVAGSLLVAVLMAASPWVAGYFRNPVAGPVLALISLNFVFNASSSVSFSGLSRALRFRTLAIVEAQAMVVHGVVAIALALAEYGVWAIAWGHLAQTAFRSVALLIVGGWAPRLGWDRGSFGELISFGAALTAKRLLNYSAANVDYFVIGRRLGPADLGFYTRAYSLMTLPLTQLSRVVMSVLFPAFSRIQDDNARLIAGYERVVPATSLVSFPFLSGLFLTAPAFIGFVYGEKWLPTVGPLQIMCVAGMMKSVSTFVGAIVDAKARVGDEIRRQLVYLALLVSGTIIGSRWGTSGVAWAVVVASLAMLIMMQQLLGRLTGMRWSTYLGALWPAVIGSLVMTATVTPTLRFLEPRLGPHSLGLLLGATMMGVVTYGLFLWLAPLPRVRALREELWGDLRRARKGSPEPGDPPGRDETCQDSPESST